MGYISAEESELGRLYGRSMFYGEIWMKAAWIWFTRWAQLFLKQKRAAWMKALGGKQEEGRKEAIRGKLGWTRTCGSNDTNPELMQQQNNARPWTWGLKPKGWKTQEGARCCCSVRKRGEGSENYPLEGGTVRPWTERKGEAKGSPGETSRKLVIYKHLQARGDPSLGKNFGNKVWGGETGRWKYFTEEWARPKTGFHMGDKREQMSSEGDRITRGGRERTRKGSASRRWPSSSVLWTERVC